MNTKLKINLSEGLLEVEGSESFVNTIYEDFKGNLLQSKPIKPKEPKATSNPTTEAKTEIKKHTANSNQKTKKKFKAKKQSIVTDLNLRPKDGKSLDDFISELNVKTNLERNVAFLYYLIHELNISGIELDHVYTCYRHLKVRVPAAFYQSVADTGVKGWIDSSNTEDLTLTSIGLNYVEHDLQSAE
jgi:hypothetical protein